MGEVALLIPEAHHEKRARPPVAPSSRAAAWAHGTAGGPPPIGRTPRPWEGEPPPWEEGPCPAAARKAGARRHSSPRLVTIEHFHTAHYPQVLTHAVRLA